MKSDEANTAAREYELMFPLYERFSNALEALFAQLCGAADVRIESIASRAKSLTSLESKLKSGSYNDLNEITDKCGIRIVTRYLSDVPRVIELTSAEFDVIEFDAHAPRSDEAFGYSSHHAIIRLAEPRRSLVEWTPFAELVAELQVRTILQHAWAIISHGLDYKSTSEVPSVVRRRLFRVAALLETGDELFDDFRLAVSDVRKEYLREVEDAQWRSLPLDLDSILATWSRLPVSKVVNLAVELGFEPQTDVYLDDLLEKDLGGLVRVATAAGLKTVGELHDFMDHIPRLAPRLGELVANAAARGDMPFAIPPDVVTFALLVSARAEAPFEAHMAGQPRFRDSLISAARAAALPE